MQRKRGREFWSKVVAAFERSGLEQRVFCERQDLALSSLQYWLYKLRAEAPIRQRRKALVRVKIAEPSSPSVPIEAGLPCGVVLRFASGTDPRYLATLATEMETQRC